MVENSFQDLGKIQEKRSKKSWFTNHLKIYIEKTSRNRFSLKILRSKSGKKKVGKIKF